jgi:hypothetical protein
MNGKFSVRRNTWRFLLFEKFHMQSGFLPTLWDFPELI